MTDDTRENNVLSPPVSPFFAREAARLLDRGELTEALRVCERGRERYPSYATASLIMGRCYEELRRIGEAVLEYRRALEILPDNPLIRTKVEQAEQRERVEFQVFAEQQIQTLKREKDSRTFEGYIREGGMESAVEFLQKKPQAPPPEKPSDQASPPEGVEENGHSAEIVTVTLAEIYAAQGQYGEAIAAYRKLMERRPEETAQFKRRIADLEDLAAASEPEKPLQE
jgi:tetratricopeptide (TPR) repeat protein